MPSQKRSRASRQQSLDRKPTPEQREEIRRAARERDKQLAALKDELVPRAREIQQEYSARRAVIFRDYDERRRRAISGATDIAPALDKVTESLHATAPNIGQEE